ncbi:hypothetical protein FKM82_018456 [Ascaphus truei]
MCRTRISTCFSSSACSAANWGSHFVRIFGCNTSYGICAFLGQLNIWEIQMFKPFKFFIRRHISMQKRSNLIFSMFGNNGVLTIARNY